MSYLSRELCLTMRIMFKGYRQRFIRAWGMVNRSDPKELGPKTSLPMQPYLQWVRARAQKLMMPYEAVLPVIVEPTIEEGIPYTVLYRYMPTDLEELQRSWIQLKNERDTYREQYHEQERKILKLTRQLEEERVISDYINTKRK